MSKNPSAVATSTPVATVPPPGGDPKQLTRPFQDDLDKRILSPSVPKSKSPINTPFGNCCNSIDSDDQSTIYAKNCTDPTTTKPIHFAPSASLHELRITSSSSSSTSDDDDCDCDCVDAPKSDSFRIQPSSFDDDNRFVRSETEAAAADAADAAPPAQPRRKQVDAQRPDDADCDIAATAADDDDVIAADDIRRQRRQRQRRPRRSTIAKPSKTSKTNSGTPDNCQNGKSTMYN